MRPEAIEDVSAYGPETRDEEIQRAVYLDRCRALARAVVELAWHDAHRSDVASVSVSKDARAFFLTDRGLGVLVRCGRRGPASSAASTLGRVSSNIVRSPALGATVASSFECDPTA